MILCSRIHHKLSGTNGRNTPDIKYPSVSISMRIIYYRLYWSRSITSASVCNGEDRHCPDPLVASVPPYLRCHRWPDWSPHPLQKH